MNLENARLALNATGLGCIRPNLVNFFSVVAPVNQPEMAIVSELAKLLWAAKIRVLPDANGNTTLFRKDEDLDDKVYVVVSGEIIVDIRGTKISRGVGCVCGELGSLTTNQVRTATVTAGAGGVELLVWEQSDICPQGSALAYAFSAISNAHALEASNLF